MARRVIVIDMDMVCDDSESPRGGRKRAREGG